MALKWISFCRDRAFEYCKGNFKWSRQEDFQDLGNANSLFQELAGAQLLSDGIKEKVRRQGCGVESIGQEEIYPAPTLLQTAWNYANLVQILLGWG